MAIKVFPVAGHVTYYDDWGQPRSGGRTHEGIDIFAPIGADVIAVDDGAIVRVDNPLGGTAWALRASDATRYYYAHLDRVAREPGPVTAGEIIGYVGTTGNAQGTRSHLHFEVHPMGGAAVPPYPLLVKNVPSVPQTVSARTVLEIVGLVAVTGVTIYAVVEWLAKTRALRAARA
jgi:murein DD-endopeptidase MepM/ murein hydrolase activator NlpD